MTSLPTVKSPRVARKPVVTVPRLIAGIDVGNHTTYFYSSIADSRGGLPVGNVFNESSWDSWIYEYTGHLRNLHAVSGKQGTTLRYLSGNPDFADRIFVCGKSALLTRGATNATLIGDNPSNKTKYGLPMLLHAVAATTKESDLECVVVGSIHDMNLAPSLKASCCGKHTFEVLQSLDTGELESTTVTVNIEMFVVQEGRSSLWHLSGAGDLEGNYPVAFDAVSVVVDGGGGTFDVLIMQEGKQLAGNSVPVGGNNMIDLVLKSATFRSRFPSNVNPDRGLVAKAIRDGSWTYVSGNGEVKVNFSDEGLQAIEQLLPTWTSVFEKTLDGYVSEIDTVVLTGGLFMTAYKGDPENEDETLKEPWSLSAILRSYYDYRFVTDDNAAALNALGSAELATLQSVSCGVPLTVGKH